MPEPFARSDWSAPPGALAPPPDPTAQPESLVVAMDTGDRIHYLDWGAPDAVRLAPGATRVGPGAARPLPSLVLLHGIGETAWTWMPVARRLSGITRVLALDQRGHGLSESPAAGYELESLAMDVLTVMVANGWGPDAGGPPVVLAGHGFGAAIAVAVAAERPAAVGGLALVDGGLEDVGRAVGDDPGQMLKALAEPPEVLASMDAWLEDRRAFDPASWDADQERAARAQVDEKHAGHVAPVVRTQALLATVTAMLSYRPGELLPQVRVPLLAALAGAASADDDLARERELELSESLRLPAGPVRGVRFPGAGHNLMRYVPDALASELAALLEVASR